ncbi:MAG: helicase-exonuclease AddAB subunit AddA [Dethiobacter sp.]|jgi:ATP-dependent helicase/nuclease subunit A|nr:helicase-exonuclease AddAB subunit AddA [Dethiobacter sp.]
MTHSWTGEQWDAITTREGNLLVSAAAGAGKTAVLVERIISLLTDPLKPVEIDRLLVVTFTEAAAAEMRERIGLVLEKKIADEPKGVLARQLLMLHGASISTLHSFCLDVIRRYFYRLDMDPSFRVADSQESVMLQQDVLEQVLEERFRLPDNESFLELVCRYGGGNRGNDKLAGIVLDLYTFMQSNPRPGSWLESAVSSFIFAADADADSALLPWLEPVRRRLEVELEFAVYLLEKASKLASLPGAPVVYKDVMLAEKEQAENLRAMLKAPWNILRAAWRQANFRVLPAAKDADGELKERITRMRDQAKKVVRSAAETYFERDNTDYLTEIRELGPLVSALAELTCDFGARFAERKKMLGLLDFNDLEHFCLRILITESDNEAGPVPSPAAFELRQNFEYVLVDEYQDINPVQDAILNLVSRQGQDEPNLFMVGDIKQSIYRFRLADPGLFLMRYHKYPDAPGSSERRLSLSYNFRCRSSVVAAVNFLFRQLMTAESAEMIYDGSAELVYGACYPDPDNMQLSWPVEVHLVGSRERMSDQGGEAEGVADENDADISGFEMEARVIAGRIREMTGTAVEGKECCHIFDSGNNCYRPLAYRDIVILLRAAAGRANQIVEVLERFGIPAYAELSTGYFSAVEVETMIALLKVVDNPRQDIELAAVLRSPLAGLSADELGSVRTYCREGDFYDAVVAAAAEAGSELASKVQSFLDRLERWRDLARSERLAAFISAVYSESGLADYVCGLPDGVQRQANLYSMFDRARQFDRFSRQGLSRFLRFINQLQASGEDLGTPRVLGEKENVVRVMSIHKAKGLEFPVVFVCGLGKKFNFQDVHREILLHRTLGISPLLVDTVNRLRYPSLPYHALRLKTEDETRAEEMRIFYVALTRARERLILIGSAADPMAESEKWQFYLDWQEKQLPAALLSRAATCLDWLGMAIARHSDIYGKDGQYNWQDGETSRWKLKLWGDAPACTVPLPETEVTSSPPPKELLALEPANSSAPLEIREEISQILGFKYKHRLSTRLPAKLSVTEAKNRLSDAAQEDNFQASILFPQAWPQPSFMTEGETLSADRRGTLYHLVMQHLDLSLPVDENGLKPQLAHLIEKKILPIEEARQIDAKKIADFFTTAAGRFVLAHKAHILREMPFIISLPASRLFQSQEEAPDENVVVQGVIDLLAVTEECCIIVDFKTGKAPEEGHTLARQHSLQLILYAEAAARILKIPVSAAYLYYFDSGSLVAIEI